MSIKCNLYFTRIEIKQDVYIQNKEIFTILGAAKMVYSYDGLVAELHRTTNLWSLLFDINIAQLPFYGLWEFFKVENIELVWAFIGVPKLYAI